MGGFDGNFVHFHGKNGNALHPLIVGAKSTKE